MVPKILSEYVRNDPNDVADEEKIDDPSDAEESSSSERRGSRMVKASRNQYAGPGTTKTYKQSKLALGKRVADSLDKLVENYEFVN